MKIVMLVLVLLLMGPLAAYTQDMGTAEVVVVDRLVDQPEFWYAVITDARAGAPSRRLHVSKGPIADERFVTGDRVQYTRSKTGVIMHPMTSRAGPSANVVSGNHPTLIILLDFIDGTNILRSSTGPDAQTLINDLDTFFRGVSYGTMTLRPVIVGPYRVTQSVQGCDTNGAKAKGDAAAKAAGVNLSQYIHLVYAMPSSSSCGWSGLGTVGGNPSTAWINGMITYPGITAHELGHNLGLWHSHALDCGTNIWAPTGCTTREYGDPFDAMGSGTSVNGVPGFFNAAQLTRLGWVTPTIAPSGTFTLRPLELHAQALRIPRRGTADSFWVELRRFPLPLVSINLQNSTGGNTIYTLDMTPASASWVDSGLTGSWTDPLSKLTIAASAITAASAQIAVSGGGTLPTACNSNGVCDAGETTASCPADCPASPPMTCNNNGVCEAGETATSCPADCTPPPAGTGEASRQFAICPKAPAWQPEGCFNLNVAHKDMFVEVMGYRCNRWTGGTSRLVIEKREASGAWTVLPKIYKVSNPTQGQLLNVRCQVTAQAVNFFYSVGSATPTLKLVAPR